MERLLKKNRLALLVALILGISLLATGIAGAKDQGGEGAGPPLTVLVVGYGWYGGIPEGQINNAETVALALDGEILRATDDTGRVVALGKVHSIVVPVRWFHAFPPVEAAIQELQPDIVVGLGTAGCRGLRVEPFGVNRGSGADANPDDPDDQFNWGGEPLVDDGPPYYQGTLPFDRMVITMREKGVPSYKGTLSISGDRYSTTTGTYLCNFMAYMLGYYREQNDLDYDFGFIHYPTRPEYVTAVGSSLTTQPSASMEMSRMIAGTRIALEECVRARAGK